MKQSKTKKPISRRQQKFSALQIRRYIERYHPEMRGFDVEISPCGTFPSVKAQKTDQK